MDLQTIRENIERIQTQMAPYPNARLMAVVKTRTPEEINAAVEYGITLLGENRVQELLSHYDALDRRADIHFIGTLQKNKVKYIVDKVSMIESLDSVPLAAEIDRHAGKHGIRMPVLIEINIGREPTKSGIEPEALLSFLNELVQFEHLIPSGLMTIAPAGAGAEEYGSYFAEMSRLRGIFAERFPQVRRPLLSMGMTASYLPALQNGSDIVRIGEGIFGKRQNPVNI